MNERGKRERGQERVQDRTDRSVLRGELIRCLLPFTQPTNHHRLMHGRLIRAYKPHYHTKSIRNIAKFKANRSRYRRNACIFRRILSPLPFSFPGPCTSLNRCRELFAGGPSARSVNHLEILPLWKLC